ncbi:Gfo/Idh/MocA family protein [Paenibacillus massiliensis]|uniref:Gfo/Idh/MocA family protein n=1 Tax=Paenibacillus massiliensis TaxID=225917 RepID=UPI0003FD86F1|nr:Gfo/Idh/MocA family oxidoreductase [Paenibacillus massiliensis]
MKIGTIGTGSIVDGFLSAASQLQQVSCTAMYSRKRETAEPLAQKYGVATIYTDLEGLLTDTAVEVVYIASPNSLHYEYARRALEHDKHVICEKPFTSTAREAKVLMELAMSKKLMLFEAISLIHLPNYHVIREYLPKLGPIRFIQCNYSQYSRKYNQLLVGETPNVFNPEFSGGALMDINIYNIHFVMNLFGSPDSVAYTANKHANGIDTSGVAVLQYPDFIAECVGSKDTAGMNFVLIQGEKGYLHVVEGPNGCRSFWVKLGEEAEEVNVQTQANRLYYELKSFYDMIAGQDLERCYELLKYSYSVMQVLDRARQHAGIVFQADQSQP